MDKAIEFFQSLGIGKIEPEFIFDSDSKTDHKIFGELVSMTCRVRFVRIGSLPIELVQPLEGKSLHKDFLDEHGDGINHIAFAVDDLAKETDKLVQQGYSVVVSASHTDAPGGLAYFDTREKFGGLYLELIQSPQHGNT